MGRAGTAGPCRFSRVSALVQPRSHSAGRSASRGAGDIARTGHRQGGQFCFGHDAPYRSGRQHGGGNQRSRLGPGRSAQVTGDQSADDQFALDVEPASRIGANHRQQHPAAADRKAEAIRRECPQPARDRPDRAPTCDSIDGESKCLFGSRTVTVTGPGTAERFDRHLIVLDSPRRGRACNPGAHGSGELQSAGVNW